MNSNVQKIISLDLELRVERNAFNPRKYLRPMRTGREKIKTKISQFKDKKLCDEMEASFLSMDDGGIHGVREGERMDVTHRNA